MSAEHDKRAGAPRASAAALDAQREQWERALTERADRFGVEASGPARAAADLFARADVHDVVELGAGQGRDTLFFAARGFHVQALDYADSAVAAIWSKAAAAQLGDHIRVGPHDVRRPLPLADASVDACFSHMLYCMALTERQLSALTAEIGRVLRPGGLNVYTARTTSDPDYGKGEHHGEGLYEFGGFVVHFFDRELVGRLAEGFDLVGVEEFEEAALPRRLYRVTLRKPE